MLSNRDIFKESRNTKRAVGDYLSEDVTLELQEHHPELKVKTYGTPIVALNGATQPT